MIVVRSGIIRGDEGRRVDHERFVVGLCDEIIAVVGTVVTNACLDSIRVVGYRAFGIEQALAVDEACRHFLQVVGLDEVAGRQLFWLKVAPIAENLHLAQVAEASALYDSLRQLVYTRLADSDFCPFARSQHRVFGIASAVVAIGFCLCRPTTADGCLCGLDVEHEADEFLHLAFAEDQRHKAHGENASFAFHSGHLSDIGQFRQLVVGYLLVSGDVGLAHLHELRILDGYGVRGVAIVVAYGQ